MESETASPPPAPESADTHAPAQKKESWWGTVRFLLLVFLGAVILRSFIVAPFSIPSGSMLPRLMIGDYLFVSKWSYGYSRYSFPFGLLSFGGRVPSGLPDRGDVVVFRYPDGGDDDFVKRVIGLPGDTIEVRGGIVILNGTPLRRERIEDYAVPITPNSPCRGVAEGSAVRRPGADGTPVCAYPRFRETMPDGTSYDVLDQIGDSEGDEFDAFTVPAGHLFVMGDNRDDSLDSRFAVEQGGVGLLPIDNLLGEVLVTFWSTDGSAEWLKPWTWFSAARWGRLG
jgi:signal peptidase I